MMLAAITLQPWFAMAGLVAITLPLWMHLYQRVASKRVMVSSMRLVPETPRATRSRRKIKHWPLFLLRALGVVLLGLAFARPGLEDQPEGAGSGREAVVFVLDRSGSMAMRSTGDTTAWEEAVQQIQSRLSNLHPQSRVRLFSFPATATGEDWITPSAMRKLVAKLELSQSGGGPVDALREAAEALARFRSNMPQSLELVGDLQRQGWDRIDTLTLPEELRVRIRQAGDPGVANSGLSLRVRGRDQMRRGAIVTRGGTAPLLVRDRLGEDGEVNESEFPLPDEVVEIPYRAAGVGWVRREVTLGQAGDGLSDDDRLFDTFYVSSEVPVYLLEPYPEREAFLQATFFLQNALRPSAGAAAAGSRFLPQTVPLNEAVKTLRALEKNKIVIAVPALQSWPEELPAVVEAIAQRGGGVLFFGGSDIRPQAYTEAWRNLLPVIPGETLELKRSLALPPVREDHPIWGGLDTGTRRSLRKLALAKRFAPEGTAD
ncbi:MAG: VWA domain-containing protein, partial [Verrucomicrobiales bacterium]|nr:VWA domain-containing protein [Verrucomicrobiales bacterium]